VAIPSGLLLDFAFASGGNSYIYDVETEISAEPVEVVLVEKPEVLSGPTFNEIYNFERYSKIYFVGTTETEKIANKFHLLGIGKKDSIHLACAIETKADYFITTDNGILKKNTEISEISILNPVDFIILIGES
jgi:predicted nucleic acid-binding protein